MSRPVRVDHEEPCDLGRPRRATYAPTRTAVSRAQPPSERAPDRRSARGRGLGQAVGDYLAGCAPRHGDRSLTVAAHRLGIPVTVHVAVGTDIIHMHPAASGAAIGETSLRDFRCFTSCAARLRGGVYLTGGSAVVLPEVFLNAVALARNQGAALDRLTTINSDFPRMYRPQTNVVRRSVAVRGGTGISFVGHHEILIPLLAAALIESGA